MKEPCPLVHKTQRTRSANFFTDKTIILREQTFPYLCYINFNLPVHYVVINILKETAASMQQVPLEHCGTPSVYVLIMRKDTIQIYQQYSKLFR